MKITKEQFRQIVVEEIKKASPLARKLLREGEVFRNSNKMLPNEWEEFTDSYLEDHPSQKVVMGTLDNGQRFEAIVDKNNEREAIIKYLPYDNEVMHDMKVSDLYRYIR